MIYAKHNFASNFMNAAGTDFDGALNILTSEIVALMEKDRAGVVKVLSDSGVRTKDNMTNGEIINAVSNELYENRDFVNNLSELIVKNNISYMEAAGESDSGSGGGGNTNWVGAISSAIGSISGIFTQGQQNKQAKEQTKQMLIAELMARQNPPKTGLSTGAVVGIVLGSLAVIGLITFAVIKMRK